MEDRSGLASMRPLILLFSVLALVVLVLLVLGCTTRDYYRIVSSGTLICGTKFDVRGFGFKDPDTGQIEGLDADLCRQIAKDYGIQPQFVKVDSDDRIPLLNAGKIDFIIGTMQVTDARKNEIDFSHPYYIAGQSLLVRRDSDIRSVSDLNGKVVCSVEGSASERRRIERKAPQADFLELASYPEAGRALLGGRCDAISNDERVLFGLLEQFKGTELRGGPFTKERLAVGIRKGKTDLLEMVNVALETMKADGRLKALYKTWIEPNTGNVPDVPF
jgi:aspartate/glutamate/glutamine transport system substrate-binding protein